MRKSGGATVFFMQSHQYTGVERNGRLHDTLWGTKGDILVFFFFVVFQCVIGALWGAVGRTSDTSTKEVARWVVVWRQPRGLEDRCLHLVGYPQFLLLLRGRVRLR